MDPLSKLNQSYPQVLPYLMLFSMLLSVVAPPLVKRFPKLATPVGLLLDLLSSIPGRRVATHEAALAARRPPATPGASLGILCLALALIGCGCSAQQKRVAVGILDVAGAVCTQVEKQGSNEYVDLACAVTDVASGVVTTFFMRVRPEVAASLPLHQEAKKCP